MIKISNFSELYQTKLVEFINSVNGSLNSPKELSQILFDQSINIPPSKPENDCYLAMTENEIVGFLQLVAEIPIGRLVGLQTIKPGPYSGDVLQKFIDLSVRKASKIETKIINFQISQYDKTSAKIFENNAWTKIKTYWNLKFENTEIEDLILPQGYSLRHFNSKKDLKALMEVQNQSFGTHWGFSPNDIGQIEYRTRMERTTEQGIIFIEKDREIAGYNWTMESRKADSAVGWIAMTGVHPSYRGLRLGRAVVLAGMHYLMSRDIPHIELEVDSENIPATHLYESIGFKKVDQTYWYQKDL